MDIPTFLSLLCLFGIPTLYYLLYHRAPDEALELERSQAVLQLQAIRDRLTKMVEHHEEFFRWDEGTTVERVGFTARTYRQTPQLVQLEGVILGRFQSNGIPQSAQYHCYKEGVWADSILSCWESTIVAIDYLLEFLTSTYLTSPRQLRSVLIVTGNLVELSGHLLKPEENIFPQKA